MIEQTVPEHTQAIMPMESGLTQRPNLIIQTSKSGHAPTGQGMDNPYCISKYARGGITSGDCQAGDQRGKLKIKMQNVKIGSIDSRYLITAV